MDTSRSIVSVSRGADPYANALAALRGLARPDLSGKRVLVKPNCGRIAAGDSGVVTHPQAVAAAADFALACGASEVAVGESPILGVDVREAFQESGVADVCRARGLPLLDLDEPDPVQMEVPDGVAIQSLKVCAAYHDFDVVVSVPVMKMHMHTGVTLSVKNMKGMLRGREKVRLHQLALPADAVVQGVRALEVAIADMATVLRPHICLVDGSVGMEGLGPSAGRPRNAQLAVAGFDAVAVDSAACRLMGLDPRDVPHLRLAAERGVGSLSPEVVPETWRDWIAEFARPPLKVSVEYPNVVVHEGDACSACLSTMLMFLKRYRQEICDYFPVDRKLHIAIGKKPGDAPPGTLFVGNCALAGCKGGASARGCPPVASDLLNAMREQLDAKD